MDTRLSLALALMLTGAVACDGGSRDTGSGASPPEQRLEGPLGWRISADAYGPLRIGMTKQAIATLLPGAFALPAPSEPGGCGYATWDSTPPGVRLMFAGDTLVRVEADSSTETLLGAKVGDPATRVDSLYGPNVRRMPHKYTSGEYLIAFTVPPVDTMHRLVFETDSAGRVTKLRAGRLPEAEWVEGCA